MEAPAVAVLRVTFTEFVNDPPFGLNVGVAAAAFLVNVAVATALLEFPVFKAMAFSVVVAARVIAPEYSVDAAVGVEPLVV
jgi:hypothetical protein